MLPAHRSLRLVVTDGVLDLSADPAAKEWAPHRDCTPLEAFVGLGVTRRAFEALHLLGVGSGYLDEAHLRLISNPQR